MKEKRIICGVYAIKHIKSSRVYIGSSKNIERRWYGHRNALKNNKHDHKLLQLVWNKDGEKSLLFSLLEECPKKKLLEREQFHINKIIKENLFNRIHVIFPAIVLSRDIRKKISKSHIGVSPSEETRNKISATLMGSIGGMLGKKQSEAAKAKMSLSKLGKIPWNKGLKGAQTAWNKGTKGLQVAWNKGLKYSMHQGGIKLLTK